MPNGTIEISENHWTNWFESLPYNQIEGFRASIIEGCKINRTIFKNWRMGYTIVPVLAQPIIDTIAGKSLDYTFFPRDKQLISPPLTA